MAQDDFEPDCISGAPHPRLAEKLVGQQAAEAAFLEAFNAGRLHHAWMLSGPRGIGKSTFAWMMAKFLLCTPEPDALSLLGEQQTYDTLSVPPEHPVLPRILAGAEPRLAKVIRTENEKTNRMRDQIVVDDIRKLSGFFQLSAADGGRRVVIVDSADEMNPQAANALLKMLEEPPKDAVIILIAHQPSALLPTIRSRCRHLRLRNLNGDEVHSALAQTGVDMPEEISALAELAAGSVGEAMRLSLLGGLEIYHELIAILGSMPRMDRERALKLADSCAQRGAQERLDVVFSLLEIALSRLARTGATGQAPQIEAVPNEKAILARLSGSPHQGRAWADVSQEALARARHGLSVNLDPGALLLDTLFKLQATSSKLT